MCFFTTSIVSNASIFWPNEEKKMPPPPNFSFLHRLIKEPRGENLLCYRRRPRMNMGAEFHFSVVILPWLVLYTDPEMQPGELMRTVHINLLSK